MIIVYAAIPALLFLAGVATYLFVQCAKYRRAEKLRLESFGRSGILLEVAPGSVRFAIPAGAALRRADIHPMHDEVTV